MWLLSCRCCEKEKLKLICQLSNLSLFINLNMFPLNKLKYKFLSRCCCLPACLLASQPHRLSAPLRSDLLHLLWLKNCFFSSLFGLFKNRFVAISSIIINQGNNNGSSRSINRQVWQHQFRMIVLCVQPNGSLANFTAIKWNQSRQWRARAK